MKKLTFFIAGTKGGVGKSFFAMQLFAAAKELDLKVKVYDSDGENRTLCRFLGKDTVFLDDSNSSYPLDAVINNLVSEDTPVTIVDMKAGTSRTTQEWFNSVPWEELSREKYEFIIVCGCTSDYGSVQTFEPWIDYFQQKKVPVHYLFILNEKDGDNFISFDKMVEKKKLPAVDSFHFPMINNDYMTVLNELGYSLRDIVSGKPTPLFKTLMERSRIRRYYYTFTSPLVCYLSRYFGKDDMTEERQKTVSTAQQRMMN